MTLDSLLNRKLAELRTKLLPHQERVRDRMKEEGRPGLVAIHGLGSGKCARGDTPIYTDRGLMRLQELFEGETLPEEGERILPPGPSKILSLCGSEQRWTGLRSRFVQKLPKEECTLRITTHRGNRVEVTSAHPLLVLRGGEMVWTPAGRVAPSDWVVMAGTLAPPLSPVDKEADHVRERNPNTGVPCSWVFEATGLSPRVLGVSANKFRSWSKEVALLVVDRLRWLALPSTRAAYGEGLGGTAKRYADRTLALLGPHLEGVASKLEALCSPLLAFEEVESVQEGEYGGWVFDLEVDASTYADHNYVGGWGGWYLHNTLTAIATQDALGVPATVVVPAALKDNYRKEQAKHVKGDPPPTEMQTIQAAATRGAAAPNPLLVVDEAHKLRDPATASHRAIRKTPRDKTLLLTASPFYNHPHDLAPLINIAAGSPVLPDDRKHFEDRYIIHEKTPLTFMQKLRGLQPGEVPRLNPRTAGELRKVYEQWTDHHPSSQEGFPTVKRETVDVLMSPEQRSVYDTTLNQAPPWVAAKVRSGMPPSKKEMANLAAFLNGPRQVGVSTSGFAEGIVHAPKVDTAFSRMKALLDSNPRAKGIVYSNYLESGLQPYRKRLEEAKIPFGEFTGELNAKARDQMVRDYNEGKLRTLLLSSAGGEGLDLKGTRLVQLLEPHWNQEKLKQVEGRAARYKSHAHLPADEQNVLIEQYLAHLEPRKREGLMAMLLGEEKKNRRIAADEYLLNMSRNKEKLIDDFRALLPKEPPPQTKK